MYQLKYIDIVDQYTIVRAKENMDNLKHPKVNSQIWMKFIICSRLRSNKSL